MNVERACMRLIKRMIWIVVPFVASLTSAVSAGYAQNLDDGVGPAEIPPSSFSGKQYVDSEGCVFIRAGFGGRANWVPRVSRSRELLCGYRPTLAQAGQRTVPDVTAKSTRTRRHSSKTAAYVETTQPAALALRMPQGYEKARKDGRDNPRRGLGTSIGNRQMALIWSNTVPRLSLIHI